MTSRKLRKCPTCRRELDDDLRAEMGLRSGEILNELCPGLTGPSDIDHVLHNGRSSPERIMFFEYKDGVKPPDGQAWLLRSLSGDWEERSNGRLLSIRFHVLPQFTADPAVLLRPAVEWVFPETEVPGGP